MSNETEIKTTLAYSVNDPKTRKRVHVANKNITLFTLAAFGIDAPYELEETELPEGDKMVQPKYSNPKLQYLQDALSQRVKAAATARYKAGEEAETSLDDLIAGRGTSSYLADIATFRVSIREFLEELGKPEKMIVRLVKRLNPAELPNYSESIQEQVAKVLQAYVDQKPEEAAAQGSMIERFNTALEKDEDIDLGL